MQEQSQDFDQIREQLIVLRKENHQLKLYITANEQQQKMQLKEYEDELEKLQNLLNDARLRLTEGSEMIRKLQQHLKICREKLSEKSKLIVAKDERLHDCQLHIHQLNDMIKQSLNFSQRQKIDVAIQTSPGLSTPRRTVRFNLDKENCPIDAKYFQSTNQ
ncbi:hypothetical protein I4U23_002001 [Adineta vaga]|nr:hypothetical protein I4U23_002001 [Adineta vaga]